MSYSICKVKNVSGSTDTWVGHELTNNQIYTIEDFERVSWMNDDKVTTDIGNEDLEVHDSSGAISGITEQINWLHDQAPIEAITQATSDYSMKSDAVYRQCAINTATNIDLKLITFTGESYDYKYVWNGSLFGANIELGDHARFFVCDVDNILGYGAGFEVKSYIEKAYMKPSPERNEFNSDAPAKIPVGLYLRCVYTAVNAGTAREIYINYDIHNKG